MSCPALLQTWGDLVQEIKMKNVLIQEITFLKERFFSKTILLFISGDVLNLFAAERPQQFHQVCWQTYWNINICTPHKIKSVLTPDPPSASLRVEQVRGEGDGPAASGIPRLPQAWVEAGQSHQLQAKRWKNKEVRGSYTLLALVFGLLKPWVNIVQCCDTCGWALGSLVWIQRLAT